MSMNNDSNNNNNNNNNRKLCFCVFERAGRKAGKTVTDNRWRDGRAGPVNAVIGAHR